MIYGAMNFPIKPVLTEINDFFRLGFDYLELAMDPPMAHHSIIREKQNEIKTAMKDYDLKLIFHMPTFVHTADLTDSIRNASVNEVLESLEVAALFKPLKIVLHPSYLGGLSLYIIEQAKEYAYQSLELIMNTANRLGLTICIENMFPKYHGYVNPEDFITIFRMFPELKMTLDLGHANIDDKSGRKVLKFIKNFQDRIEHIHASDNFGKYDEHLSIGEGNVNFPKITKKLKGIGYDKTVTLEIFSENRKDLKSSKEKLSKMLLKY